MMSGRPGHDRRRPSRCRSPCPRDPEIRFTAEFAELVGEVSHALREGHHSMTADDHSERRCRTRPPGRGPRQRRRRAGAAPALGAARSRSSPSSSASGTSSATSCSTRAALPAAAARTRSSPRASRRPDVIRDILRGAGAHRRRRARRPRRSRSSSASSGRVAMSQARWVERSLFPYAVILQCIPILALVPLIGFWFGFDFPPRVIVCVMIALFPIVSNTLFGLQSVDRGQRELFQLQDASPLDHASPSCSSPPPCPRSSPGCASPPASPSSARSSATSSSAAAPRARRRSSATTSRGCSRRRAVRRDHRRRPVRRRRSSCSSAGSARAPSASGTTSRA